MKHKTFLEVMAGPEGIRLTHSQKRVLRKVIDSTDPRLAAEQVASADDSRNLIGASKTLVKYGYITTDPFILGDDDEPKTIELTEKGEKAVQDYDIENDPSLISDDEKEESDPQGEMPTAEIPGEAGAAELPDQAPVQGGGPAGLELSSFFREINASATQLND